MGYRLGIDIRNMNGEIENKYYGTKYFGYGGEDNSLSYDFLKCIGRFDGTEHFGYSEDNEIVLNKREFELFCKLYDLDLKNTYDNYSFIDDEEIQEILGKYAFYILNWG